MSYIILFFAILASNLMPAFMPPTWTLIVFTVNYYHLEIWLVVTVAVLAATTGRYFLMEYIQWFSEKIFNKWEQKNLDFLGKKIGNSKRKNFLFTFLYSMTPLPTTQFFLAASLAKLPRFPIMLGFFFGRIVSYSLLAYTSVFVVNDLSDLFAGKVTWQSVLTLLISTLVMLVLIFLDWHELLINKKIRLQFKIWRWNKI